MFHPWTGMGRTRENNDLDSQSQSTTTMVGNQTAQTTTKGEHKDEAAAAAIDPAAGSANNGGGGSGGSSRARVVIDIDDLIDELTNGPSREPEGNYHNNTPNRSNIANNTAMATDMSVLSTDITAATSAPPSRSTSRDYSGSIHVRRSVDPPQISAAASSPLLLDALQKEIANGMISEDKENNEEEGAEPGERESLLSEALQYIQELERRQLPNKTGSGSEAFMMSVNSERSVSSTRTANLKARLRQLEMSARTSQHQRSPSLQQHSSTSFVVGGGFHQPLQETSTQQQEQAPPFPNPAADSVVIPNNTYDDYDGKTFNAQVPFSLALGPPPAAHGGGETNSLLKPSATNITDDDDCYEDEPGAGGGTRAMLTANSNTIVDSGFDKDGQAYVEMCFTPDTFSFLITSQVCSPPFCLGLWVFFLQLAFFILVGSTMVDFEDPENLFKMPANVNYSVRATQALAMVVAVMTQGDMIIAFDQMRDGYCINMSVGFQYATRKKFWFSVICRFIEGTFGLMVSFFLIVTSETVIDLLLNFTALEFVSGVSYYCLFFTLSVVFVVCVAIAFLHQNKHIPFMFIYYLQYDDGFFYLAQKGFLGKRNEKEVDLVENTTYRTANKRFRRAGKFGMMLFFIFALLCGLIAIMTKQNNGEYVCQHLQVQFSDDLTPSLGTFSGIYDRQTELQFASSSQYVSYVDRLSGKAFFSYCASINAWTFHYDKPGVESDPCEWVARSEETYTFDITDTASLSWFTRDKYNREVILDPFTLLCDDCKSTGAREECLGRGKCHDGGECVCDSGWFGNRCEFREPCPTLALDSSNAGFSGAREWPRKYEMMKDGGDPVVVYGRPVYMYKDSDILYFLIFFTGRRWVLTSTNFFNDGLYDDLKAAVIENDGKNVLVNYFQNRFHAHWSDFLIGYVTEPMDVRTPGDASSPVALKWFVAEIRDSSIEAIQAPDSALPVEDAIFLCSFCDNATNPCQFDGVCQSNGYCKCAFGARGELCEKPPIGNGKCDTFYNRERYEFDGGDCCESTCVSADIQCGMWESTYVSRGYPECKQETGKWYEHGTIEGEEPGSWSGSSVALSNEGNIMAVGEYGGVRVFDKDGSKWVFRSTLPMPPGTAGKTVLPYRIRLTQLDDSVTSNPSTLPRIRVTVLIGFGEELQTHQTVYVYECGSRCDVGEKEVLTASLAPKGLARNLTVFDMATSGKVLAVVSRDESSKSAKDYKYQGNIEVHDLEARSLTLRDTLNVTGAMDVRLSQNGERLAVLVLEDNHWYIENFFWTGSDYVTLGKRISVQAANTFAPIASLGLDGYSTFALAGNGQVLAIAPCETPRHIHVFELKRGEWTPRGSPSINDVQCDTDGTDSSADFLTYLALSNDGSELAFGGQTHDPLGDSTTDVYKWTGRAWEVKGSWPGILYGELALSKDGTDLALGNLYGGTGATGITTILSSPETTKCGDGKSLVLLSFTDDGSCFDGCGWILMNHKTKEVVIQSKRVFPENVETVAREVCLDVQQECYAFVAVKHGEVFDEPSAYGVFVDAEQVAMDSLAGKAYVRNLFGNCPDSNVTQFHQDCEGEDESSFKLSVMLDMFPSETAWTLVWNKTDSPPEPLMVEGPFRNRNRLNALEEKGCWNIEDNCYILTLYESHGLGMRLSEFASMTNSEGVSLSNEHSFDGNFYARRSYFGDCPVCPEGTSRFEAMVKSCEVTEWNLTASHSGDEELVMSGDNVAHMQDFAHFLGENATAYCVFIPAEDFRSKEAAYGNIFYEAEAYWMDACLDMSFCYEFSVLEGETTRFSLLVDDEDATKPHHHNKLMESSVSFGNCEFNPFEE